MSQSHIENDRSEEALRGILQILKSDCSYSKKIFTEYEFAKTELSKADIQIDPNMHKSMADGYKKLTHGLWLLAKQADQNFHTVIHFRESPTE